MNFVLLERSVRLLLGRLRILDLDEPARQQGTCGGLFTLDRRRTRMVVLEEMSDYEPYHLSYSTRNRCFAIHGVCPGHAWAEALSYTMKAELGVVYDLLLTIPALPWLKQGALLWKVLVLLRNDLQKALQCAKREVSVARAALRRAGDEFTSLESRFSLAHRRIGSRYSSEWTCRDAWHSLLRLWLYDPLCEGMH